MVEVTNFRVSYSPESILSTLNTIKDFINSAEFKPLNNSNDVDIAYFNSLICIIEDKIRENNCERVIFDNSSLSPKRLRLGWYNLNSKLSDGDTDDTKNSYERLLKITLRFLEQIKSLPISSFIKRKNEEAESSARVKDQHEEQKRLDILKKRRLELKKQYDDALNESPVDEKKLSMLREKLKELGVAFIESKKTIDSIKTDAAEEERLRVRIDRAFDELGQDSHLDYEMARLRTEYRMTLWAIPILISVFIALYVIFLFNLKSLCLANWYEYMPYTMSVPIFVALLWLMVYLKNRANKISIELSAQVYNIHYIEGLLKLTNSMSRSSTRALENIERIVDNMVDSFLENMKRQQLGENNLSKIERQELEDSPYWKFLKEIKDIIMNIKQQ